LHAFTVFLQITWAVTKLLLKDQHQFFAYATIFGFPALMQHSEARSIYNLSPYLIENTPHHHHKD
jgi:hypothetical protein